MIRVFSVLRNFMRSIFSINENTKKVVSETKLFVFSFMEKMLFIQFHIMEKCLSYKFIVWKKCLSYSFLYGKSAYFAIFIHTLLLYEIV